MSEQTGLIHTRTQTILPQWCDYNGHMNVAYYTLAFENAVFEAQEVIGFGQRYVEQESKSLFTLKANYNFVGELNEGESLYVDI